MPTEIGRASCRWRSAVYRGWDALEQQFHAEERAAVIDFDLVPEITESEHFDTRDQVLARILELRDTVQPVDEIGEFILAKLGASAHYLRALQGEQVEFYQHVRNILGVTPELISEQVIAEQRARVFSLLASLGVPFNGETPDPAGFKAFDDRILIDEAQAKAEADEADARFRPIVLSLLGLGDLQIPYHTELVSEDAYWRAWTSGTKNDLLLRYNFHRTHRWRQGDMEVLTLHEVCGHFVHAVCMARRIEAGELDPFIGITTVHDPHGFMGEGIADALTYFFPEEIGLSAHAVLAREQYKWRDYLNNNAHILVNMGWPEDRLLAYLLDNL
ncbi:MAG: hypothetical protein M1337_06375, partial [Actinobacteria bacterium]|nr:hypothetical protein [Actinomycetota bacterium]